MHGMLEHRLAAKVLDNDGYHALQRGGRICRVRHTLRFEEIDDIDGVLDDLAIRRLQHRDNPTTDLRQDAGRKIRVPRGHFNIVNALVAQVATCLAGVKRV